MSQEAMDVVKRFMGINPQLLGSPDPSGSQEGHKQVADDLLAPDFRVPVATSLPHGGDWVGREGYLKMSQAFHDAWVRMDIATHEFFEAGDDRVIVVISTSFQARTTGKVVDHRMVEIFTVRDGKITELVPYYWDTALLVDAYAGTPPSSSPQRL